MTVIVDVFPVVAPATTVIEGPLSVKLEGGVTVRAMAVDAVNVPELPVRVTVTGPPVAAVLLAVSVSMLEFVAGLVAKNAVTPLGRPDAESDTAPAKPPTSVTKTVLVALAPWATVTLAGETESVKPGGGATVKAIVVDAAKAPEVPLMVTVTGPPVVAVLLAVSVSTLEFVAGLVAKAAVTPLGRPDAESATAPAKPFTSATEMVLVPCAPWATVTLADEAESVKSGGGATVKAIMVDAANAPEVPLMVTVTGPPAVAVLLAVSVSTLEFVVGLAAKAAVTPLGRPVAARVTAPVNPSVSLTLMVSVLLLPWTTERVGAEDESVKSGFGLLMVTFPTLPA